ncbi:malonyl-ACP O-methyltransferase BioC [Aureibacter tunicatorum]|uniref:Malonyl-[acyl-carrier protein] O-methyltransferase n=1 Tax=Aureibacter tunicatorum TaxID=866807 RepID=A0AAE4BTH2_9BACT|nr:malonyl-ACP O-methyltransferase BioC [Aureibacter tunicatorum]MDR6239592.1 malonyl-CoA O-methyltransferase [Aureibacter tunicatorum]BDD04069.1 malonyl-[acyl-carrier protein] O-methyltransferase [Aureibacter tunicatorum]
MNKELVKERFDKSLKTYDSNAKIQKSIASKLFKLSQDHFSVTNQTIFEIGCGTGFLTREIMNKAPKHIFANDLNPNAIFSLLSKMSNEEKSKIDFLSGDIEKIDFPANTNSIFSASTIQWITDIRAFAEKLHHSTDKQATIAISSFGNKNLYEIKEITGAGLTYDTSKLLDAFKKHFDILHFEEETKCIYFQSPIDILRHLKLTGVNGISKTTWNKSSLQNFQRKYSQYQSDKGYTLTYNPLYIIGKKKNV